MRIIVIAPSIDPSVVHHMVKLKVNVDLLELNRYRVQWQDILSINYMQSALAPKARPFAGLGVYELPFYEKNYNSLSAVQFFEYIDAMRELVEQEGWPLDIKFNKGYVVWKHGYSQAFGITWLGSKSFAFMFKLSKAEIDANLPEGIEMTRYEEGWKHGTFKIEPGKTKIEDYLPLLRACVSKLVGGPA